jgi:outer membrane protein assembly factor BamB
VVYCVTGNGASPSDRGRWTVPHPDAPSFLAVDKVTGKVIWSSNAPGKKIAYGQWSTPAFATVDGTDEVLFPGGDGYLYSFERNSGKLLWQINCDDMNEKWPSFIVSPPLVVGDVAYVSVSRDVEFTGTNPHPLYAIDLKTHKVLWTYSQDRFNGTLGPMAVSGNLLIASALSGLVVALDARTGKEVWHLDLEDQVYGGVCMDHGKLYVGSDNILHVIATDTGRSLREYDFDSGLAGTPVVADGNVYVATADTHWCLNVPE